MSRGTRGVPPARTAVGLAVFLVMTGLLLSAAGCDGSTTSSSQGGVTSPTASGAPAVWTNLNPAGEVPSRRAGQSMVYDPINNRAILFGGWDGDKPLKDTWAYDLGANAWTRLEPAGKVPSQRSGHSMVYDPVSSRAILFGGEFGGQRLNDTWAYDPGANTWTRLDPTGDLPLGRAGHSMVYDSVGGRVILFGGTGSDQLLNDTWTYDASANAWTLLDPTGDPAPVHSDHSMAYDPISKKVILFGGFDQNGYPADDTWTYDPVADAWTELTPAGASPPASIGHRMVYDPATGRVILLGGGDGKLLYNDTWAYDPGANTWTRLDLTGDLPPGRTGHSMVYDPVGGRVILFGGTGSGSYLNDTWDYGGSPSVSVPPTSTAEPSVSITEPSVSTTTVVPIVTSYNDKAAFEAAASSPLQLVDFDTDHLGVPIVAESPGVLAGAYYKGYGILFRAGVIFGEPNFPFNGVSAPNTITDSGDNTPSLAIVDVVFGDPVHEVGITNIGAEAVLRIFDEDDTLIGSVRSDKNEATKDFIGLISNIPIRRMEYDFAGGMSFEGDDLLFTRIVF